MSSVSLETVKTLADAIQSIVIAAGILIGGAWALFRFRALKDLEKATAELEKAKRDLAERGNLKIELKPTQFHVEGDPKLFVTVELTLTNVGNRTEVIRWADSRVSVAHLICSASGEIQKGPAIESRLRSVYEPIVASTIDPGTSSTYAFLFPLEVPGLYLLDADLKGSPEETEASLEKARRAGLDPQTRDIAGWGATTYLNVQRESAARQYSRPIDNKSEAVG
jgi:hypothetical protein